jgi:hypothetical protein
MGLTSPVTKTVPPSPQPRLITGPGAHPGALLW